MTDQPPLAEILPPELKELRWKPLLSFFLNINKPYDVADRRISTIAGGYFEGERLRGKILFGNDWQVVRKDGAVVIDVRALLETDDGEQISMKYQGLRHGDPAILAALGRGEPVNPLAYYMRVSVMFETSSEKYGFLNDLVAVAHGHRLAAGAIYNVFELV